MASDVERGWWRSTRVRRYLADTFALVAFSTLAGMATELFIAGMTLAQSAQARATAVPVMLLTARPYGLFRDWVFEMSGAAAKGNSPPSASPAATPSSA